MSIRWKPVGNESGAQGSEKKKKNKEKGEKRTGRERTEAESTSMDGTEQGKGLAERVASSSRIWGGAVGSSNDAPSGILAGSDSPPRTD